MNRYDEIYTKWKADPQAFWAKAASAVDWFKPCAKVFDEGAGPYGRWFPGACATPPTIASTGTSRRAAAGRARSSTTGRSPEPSGHTAYPELRDGVAPSPPCSPRWGRKGDRVVIYMAMVPEALIAMLACARLGAVHSVVFGGFAAPELAVRIDDAKPKAVGRASCGIEPGRVVAYKPLLDAAHRDRRAQARASASSSSARRRAADLVEGRDYEWDELIETQVARAGGDCVPVAAMDPLYILYTSGTTDSRRASCATTAATWWRSPGR